MKKIVIAHNYTEKSFSAMSYYLANYLAENGYTVIFVSYRPYFPENKVIKVNDGQIILYSWTSKKRPTNLKDFFFFSRLFLKYKPEIIIGHFVGGTMTILVSKLLSLGRAKTFKYYHTLRDAILEDSNKKASIWQRFLIIRQKIFFKLFCDAFICPSKLAKCDLEKYYSIHNGLEILNPMADRFKGKSRSYPQNTVISYLGRLDDTKGVLDLIEAFNKFCENNPHSTIKLNIAGSGSREEEVKKMISKNEKIKYLGYLQYDQIDDYLSSSDFTIIPSKFDNLPTVGVESLMNQTPLLISTNTGLTSYLENGYDCITFEPTVEAIVDIFETIENKEINIEQMSLHARKTFLQKFSLEEYCKAFSAVI